MLVNLDCNIICKTGFSFDYINTVYCSRSFSIDIRFAGVCCELFMAMRYKFNLVTYVQRPLLIGRRSGKKRNLNEITAGNRQRTLAVEGGKQSRTGAMWVSASDHFY